MGALKNSVIDGPSAFMTLLSFRGRFKLELLGMTSRTPTLKVFNQQYGHKFTRKQQALDWCEARISEIKAGAQRERQRAAGEVPDLGDTGLRS